MALFICSDCGYGSASWLGKCPHCSQWNTFKEQPSFEKDSNTKKEKLMKMEITTLKKISTLQKGRIKTGIFEFDRVLGGGFIAGAIILLTGEPGVGKSTLLLQSLQNIKTIYISGEESAEQIKERAQRLKINMDNMLFSDSLQIEGIIKGLKDMENKYDVIAIDSIQTIYSKEIDSPPGSISQLKETAAQIAIFGKKYKKSVIIIGHITKGGDIAGPKTLEHMVDCVINFEGEKVSNFRILRSRKNRYGASHEIGIFEMKETGLCEVKNPLLFLDNTSQRLEGKAIIGIAEGKRCLFFEIQTLAVPTMLPIPRRVVKGLNYNKILLLLAVVRKHLKISLDKYDIYVNIVGGVDIKSTGADLGFIASLISSIKDIPLSSNSIFTGEVGLSGEIRKTYFQDKIISEAKRLGFKNIYSSNNITNVYSLKKLLKI